MAEEIIVSCNDSTDTAAHNQTDPCNRPSKLTTMQNKKRNDDIENFSISTNYKMNTPLQQRSNSIRKTTSASMLKFKLSGHKSINKDDKQNQHQQHQQHQHQHHHHQQTTKLKCKKLIFCNDNKDDDDDHHHDDNNDDKKIESKEMMTKIKNQKSSSNDEIPFNVNNCNNIEVLHFANGCMNKNNEKEDDIESEEGYDDAVGSSMESTLIDNKDYDCGEINDGECSSGSSSSNNNCCFNNINNNNNNNNDKSVKVKKSFSYCSNPDGCITLKDILSAFNAPISEDQAWALIFQYVKLYRDSINLDGFRLKDIQIPSTIDHLNLHNDGSVHINIKEKNIENSSVTSQKKILMQIGRIIFEALDYNLQEDEVCLMSGDLEEIISYMTFDDVDDEGIERDAEDYDEEKCINTKELDDIIQTCIPRIQPAVAENHYRAVCRALVTETLELRIFLQKVFRGDTESLRIKVDAVTSKQELDKLEFNDWARFWMQVVDELRRGVRLKKNDSSRAPVEYELTPYEILMGDIRARKFNLRKVMVNGDIPPRVKKDAHAVILEFIRSRPPLKKASDRKLLPPIQRNPSPREQLMDSIRKGRMLKPVDEPNPPKKKIIPPATQQVESLKQEKRDEKSKTNGISKVHQSPRSKQRLIKVDFSLLQDDDDDLFMASGSTSLQPTATNQSTCSQPRMPAYPIAGYNNENNPNNINTSVLRRTTYDLATQCESRRASIRRHTIVGCQSNLLKNETHSMPPSRPNSRQSNDHVNQQQNQQQQQQQQQHPASSSKPPIFSTNSNIANTMNISINKTKKSHNLNGHPHQHQHHHPNHQTQLLEQQQQQQQQQQNNVNNINNINNNNNNSKMIAGNSNNSCSSSTCTSTTSNLTSMETWTKNSLDENQWSDKISDRLSLTLEEIVHIRSVMTKAELEGLPVGVRVKEDVERRKICFLCLKTRFSIFGSWGIQCKLCQRTVCSKCYSKMRIPTEHFRNVPVVLLSPSLMGSPAGSSTPSPSHHLGGGHVSSSTILDESFPKSLMERLLRSESDRKTRNTVGSAPSSPKNQRSNMSTPGSIAQIETTANCSQSMTKSMLTATAGSDSSTHLGVNNKENFSGGGGCGGFATTSMLNGSGCAQNRQVAGIMSRSMEGPRSLPIQSPGRPHSNSSTLDRKNRFARAFTLSSSAHLTADQKENLRGEMMAVCNDCRGLVLEIIRSSRQTRSSARNRTLKNLTLDLSPVYKY